MTKEMTFNGVDMSRFFRIIDIIRPIGNKRSVSTDDAPLLGVNIQKVKRGEKEHTIKFDLKTTNAMEMEQLKHELASVLDVLEPVKITYSDEPDKYYMGLLVDDITPDNLTRWFQRSEIKILIPDGVAHSSTYRKFDSGTDATVSSEKMVFTLKNNGTVPAHPIVTVKHNAENGYIGLVNQNSALEVGNREEADTETVKQSELLLDYRDNSILTGFSRAAKNVGITNDRSEKLVGTANTISVWGRQHIQLANRGTVTAGYNSAATLTWDIPNDSSGGVGSLNDYIWWRQIFWLGASNQYGFIKVTVSDVDGNFLYGVETYSRSQGLGCEYNFLASDGKGGYNILKRWTFTGTHLDHHNPFNSTRGWSDLKRNDDKVQVYWWGSYPTFTIPEIKGKKSVKVHVTLGAYGNYPLVTHMYLDSIYYRKDFVPVTKNIPNRFAIGSNVVINSEDDTVYIDGIAKTSEVVDGSKWLAIPPGTSQLELYVSSFVSNKPTVKIEFEERWL
ncbi:MULTISPECIES: distal tail protein Dit [Streptococcus]|uniref:Distal tail protein Dit n=1 Tax=Streptococcus caledonicus TaxID=2614158 RepID=A0ABW0UC73_9STRE|nr:distal tail protein Dit [Streptococcus sp. S784/96/1]